MLPQSGHIRHHQVRTGLSGIFQQDVQTCFQTGSHHQRHLAGELLDGRTHGVQNLGHNGGNDGAFNIRIADAIDLHEDLQIHTVLIRSLGRFCPQARLKNDLLVPDTTQYNIRISDINS